MHIHCFRFKWATSIIAFRKIELKRNEPVINKHKHIYIYNRYNPNYYFVWIPKSYCADYVMSNRADSKVFHVLFTKADFVHLKINQEKFTTLDYS